jgi:nitrite reductase (NADH) large subunit
MIKPTIVVVGNGMVGYKFCEKLVNRSSDFRIIVFGEEPRHTYDRVHLSEYFNGKTAEDLSLSSRSWYEEHDILLHLGDPVQEINRSTKTVHSLM